MDVTDRSLHFLFYFLPFLLVRAYDPHSDCRFGKRYQACQSFVEIRYQFSEVFVLHRGKADMAVHQPSHAQSLKLRFPRHRHEREGILVDSALTRWRGLLGFSIAIDVMMMEEVLMCASVAAELRQWLFPFLSFTLIAVVYLSFILELDKLLPITPDRRPLGPRLLAVGQRICPDVVRAGDPELVETSRLVEILMLRIENGEVGHSAKWVERGHCCFVAVVTLLSRGKRIVVAS